MLFNRKDATGITTSWLGASDSDVGNRFSIKIQPIMGNMQLRKKILISEGKDFAFGRTLLK